MPYAGASVDESTKGKWEDYIKDSDYGSMSELIRAAVRREINRGEGDSTGASRGESVEVERLQEQQQTTIQKIESLAESFREAQEEREAEEYPEEVKAAAFEIAGDLDTISPDEFREMSSNADIERVKLASEHFDSGEETHRVIAALDYLEENVQWIRRKPTPPSDYYRVEE